MTIERGAESALSTTSVRVCGYTVTVRVCLPCGATIVTSCGPGAHGDRAVFAGRRRLAVDRHRAEPVGGVDRDRAHALRGFPVADQDDRGRLRLRGRDRDGHVFGRPAGPGEGQMVRSDGQRVDQDRRSPDVGAVEPDVGTARQGRDEDRPGRRRAEQSDRGKRQSGKIRRRRAKRPTAHDRTPIRRRRDRACLPWTR